MLTKYNWITYAGTPSIVNLPWKGEIVHADYLFRLANENPEKEFELKSCVLLFDTITRKLRQANVTLIDCTPIDLEVM